ncbi:molybdate ABC transporter substrate-binding protein [Vibrio sp. Isolate23]|uniref:molybdate ABC transporter substrate-binding protein n=1 Tax=Vibrio sp. Isolate23 TaxID=2908533 RepID=UPI0031F31930
MMIFFKRLTVVIFTLFSSVVVHASVNVYAASSMTNVIKKLAEEFQTETGTKVIPVFAGSSSLARQILNGAPADIFISANLRWSDYLIQKGMMQSDNVTNLAENQLVVVAPLNKPTNFDVRSSEQWLKKLSEQRIAIGQTNAVPAGMYAKESLETLGVWESLRDHLAPVNNVRAALTLVERGETPLGIVYITDAMVSDKVKVVATLPSSTYSLITYPMARLNEKPATLEFEAFLQSEKAQAILKQYGFN